MNKLSSAKQINLFTLLLATTYMVSYITRINFGAVISEMEIATDISRELLSMSLTGSFITYGAGQIISGVLGDRISPKRLVSLGLSLSVIMNLLIPLCKSPYQMLAVWCINGFAQSFMWPPLVRLMTELLSADDYKQASQKVSWGSSIGTIIIYLLAPIVISAFGWKWVFVISAAFGAVMLFVWNRFCYEIQPKTQIRPKNSQKVKNYKLFTPLTLGIMLAIMLQGMLRDGVTTWMPSYIAGTYNLSNIVSILSGVVLPIFSILCFYLATKLYTKCIKNPLACAGVFFFIGTVSALALFLVGNRMAIASVLLSAILTGGMHGVNLMLICMIPPLFEKQGNISTVSGILNSCTYIGSAVSTYLIAVLSQNIGWHSTIFVWFLIALLGTVVCFLGVAPLKRKYL